MQSTHGGPEPWDTETPVENRRQNQDFAEPDEVDLADEGSESAEQPGESERPPRRRRRRRRPRSRKERPGQPIEQQEREETTDEGQIEDERSDEFLSEDDEVESEEPAGERELSENRPPRRRRRRRRRPGERGPRREPSSEEPLTDVEAEEAFPSESPLGISPATDDEEESADIEGDLEGEDDEAPRVYRNVPTWEEAISYLLHRRPNESRSRKGDSGGSREHRRDGGRRPDRGDCPQD